MEGVSKFSLRDSSNYIHKLFNFFNDTCANDSSDDSLAFIISTSTVPLSNTYIYKRFLKWYTSKHFLQTPQMIQVELKNHFSDDACTFVHDSSHNTHTFVKNSSNDTHTFLNDSSKDACTFVNDSLNDTYIYIYIFVNDFLNDTYIFVCDSLNDTYIYIFVYDFLNDTYTFVNDTHTL